MKLPGTPGPDEAAHSSIEHEIQRLMLERLGIEWVPGEPFYSLVEAEIVRLRQEVERVLIDNAELSDECDQWESKQEQSWLEIADLRAQLAACQS